MVGPRPIAKRWAGATGGCGCSASAMTSASAAKPGIRMRSRRAMRTRGALVGGGEWRCLELTDDARERVGLVGVHLRAAVRNPPRAHRTRIVEAALLADRGPRHG